MDSESFKFTESAGTTKLGTIGWAKQDLWENHFGKRTACTMTLLKGPKDPVLPTLGYLWHK